MNEQRMSSGVLCLALIGVFLIFAAACGGEEPVDFPDVGVGDDVVDGDNPCGGDADLNYDGESAYPGDSCGECADGVLVCDGLDELRCHGASEANECGGCEPLPASDGDSCGPCDDGAWACQDDGTLACEGASERNMCGGCGDLDGSLGAGCEFGDGSAGVYGCASTDELQCVGPGQNACGGTSDLAAQPGTPCGDCNLGVVVCDGSDSVTCEDEDAGVNACGGCAPLAGQPEEACGLCEGEWYCATDDVAVCDDDAQNACGGCAELDGQPGEECNDQGAVWACDGTQAVVCPDEPTNACGGDTSLGERPGEVCGECGDGQVICVSPETTACFGAGDTNDCGGCGLLSAEEGESCGTGAVWECTDDGSMRCEVDDNLNACGGTEPLGALPGEVCGPCDLDVYVCDGDDQVVCSGSTPCPDYTIQEVTASDDQVDRVIVDWTEVEAAVGYVVYRDGEQIAEVAADTTLYEDTDADEPSDPSAPEILSITRGDRTDGVEVEWAEPAVESGEEHDYEVAAVAPDGIDDEPAGDTGHKAAPDIAGYELCKGDVQNCEGDDWEELDTDDGLVYFDEDAPMGSVVQGDVSASDGEFVDYVELRAEGWEVDGAPERFYNVRAVTDLGEGEPSDESDSFGYRDVGEPAYEWFGSALDDSDDFASLYGPAQDGDVHHDSDAPEDGSERTYRVRVSAEGAVWADSDEITGHRALEAEVNTVMVDDITATSATVFGDLDADGGAADEVGFCWHTAAPAEDGTCEAVDTDAQPGDAFSLELTALEPGTGYWVRAFATGGGSTEYATQLSFTTVPDAVDDLTATSGDSPDYVRLEWSDVEGADEYRIYRDGEEVDTVDAVLFDDIDADEGDIPNAPSVSATDGTHTDRIAVTWNTPSVDDGTEHTYQVAAVNSFGEGDPSNTAGGYRAGYPVESFHIQINDGSWFSVGDSTSYNHYLADDPTVDPGVASAGEGGYVDHVELDVSQAAASEGDTTDYRVRAVNETGNGVTKVSSGYKGVGELTYEWQRTDEDDENAEYFELSVDCVDEPECDDTTAPDGGAVRHYRVVVGAEGADDEVEYAGPGYRAVVDLAFEQSPADPETAGESFDIAVQLINQNDEDLEFDGVDIAVALNQHQFASGVDPTATTDATGLAAIDDLVLENADDGYTLTATVEDDPFVTDLSGVSTDSDPFSVQAGDATGTYSTISGEDGAVADGEDEAEITIELYDDYENPIEGVTPEFSAVPDDGNTYHDCSDTDAQGVSICQMSTMEPGEKTLWIDEPLSVEGGTVDFETPECVASGEPYGGGVGTSDDPYTICTAEHLNQIGLNESDWSDYFAMTDDIDLQGVDYNIIGSGSERFSGTFDGGDYVISNLTIDDPDQAYVGVFAAADDGAVIENLGVEDIELTGYSHVGGLVGRNAGQIINSYATGALSGEYRWIGGLVGLNVGGITRSYANVDVSGDDRRLGGLVGRNQDDGKITMSHASGDVTGGENSSQVGGLVGQNIAGAQIIDAYATGDVEGNSRVGGFVGWNTGTSWSSGIIENGYSTGHVDGNSNVGGFVGENDSSDGEIDHAFWDENTSGMDNGIGTGPGDVTGLSTDDFADESHFTDAGWDFGNNGIWTIGVAPDNKERPILHWQED